MIGQAVVVSLFEEAYAKCALPLPNSGTRCACGRYHYKCGECGADCTAGAIGGPATTDTDGVTLCHYCYPAAGVRKWRRAQALLARAEKNEQTMHRLYARNRSLVAELLGMRQIVKNRDAELRALRQRAEDPEPLAALGELVFIINAAGLLHLSNGVQLGATSWYVKADERLKFAEAVIAKAKGRSVGVE